MVMTLVRPLVSVGVPTFNRPENLRRSLACISGQTYFALEIIVSDNASPGDDTKQVVEEWMQKDKRIKYVRQPLNLGPVANFQYLLDSAKGEYFLWFADDDWRAESYIETLVQELQSDSQAVLAFCDIAVLDERGMRRDDFYKSYLPYLRKLTSSNRLVRMTRFFLQDESLGKANLVYGLMRKNAAKDISLDSLCRHYGFYGLDNLFVFILLGKGTLRLVDGMFYGCTAGNVKHYTLADLPGLKGRLQTTAKQFKYLFAYLGLSSGVLRVVIASLLPVKFVFFCWHILMGKLKRYHS